MVKTGIYQWERTTNWNELYNKLESIYNPYPVQMSRAEAFGKAMNDGLITDKEYKEAREFYGNLWNYTGD